jgi:hypothetical protein
MLERGATVTVITYRGVPRRGRVWEDTGPGVLVCLEEEWQRALRAGEEPHCVGFPKRDVTEVMGDGQQEGQQQNLDR